MWSFNWTWKACASPPNQNSSPPGGLSVRFVGYQQDLFDFGCSEVFELSCYEVFQFGEMEDSITVLHRNKETIPAPPSPNWMVLGRCSWSRTCVNSICSIWDGNTLKVFEFCCKFELREAGGRTSWNSREIISNNQICTSSVQHSEAPGPSLLEHLLQVVLTAFANRLCTILRWFDLPASSNREGTKE